jgi:hypothetical protein
MDVLLLIFHRNLLCLMVQVNLLGLMNRRSNVVTPVGCHFVLDAISPRCRRSVVSDADSKSTARATGGRGASYRLPATDGPGLFVRFIPARRKPSPG